MAINSFAGLNALSAINTGLNVQHGCNFPPFLGCLGGSGKYCPGQAGPGQAQKIPPGKIAGYGLVFRHKQAPFVRAEINQP
jgi:hypothetical protein